MSPVRYTILEYAESELEERSTPFLVAFRFLDDPYSPVRSFILSDWRRLVAPDQVADVAYIEDFLYDLRQQSYLEEAVSESFFEIVDRLSVGPIRTGQTGSCPIGRLQEVKDQLATDVSKVEVCSEETFGSLLKSLHSEAACRNTCA